MIGALVTLAAAHPRNTSLQSVPEIAIVLEPMLGELGANMALSFAILGGALCSVFVVSLTAAWAVCEAGAWEDTFSLDRSPSEAPVFYACFIMIVLVSCVILSFGINVVKLNVYIELVDALLMPMAVIFLFLNATAADILPPDTRVVGAHKALLAIIFTVCSMLAIVATFSELLDRFYLWA